MKNLNEHRGFYPKLLAILTVVGLGTAASVGAAGCRHRDPEQRAQWMVNKITSELELTEAQKPKLQAVADYVLAERKALRAQHEEHLAFALSQVRAEKLNEAEIEKRINTRLDRLREKAPRLVDLVADLHASLTPEQREKAATKLEKLKKWHK